MAVGLWAYLAASRRTGDALHPLGLFLAGWLMVFGFAHILVPRTFVEPYYAEAFRVKTYGVVLGAMVAFMGGFFLVDPGLRPVDRLAIGERLEQRIQWDRLAVWTLALFSIASAVTWYFVRVAGAIPLLSPNIDQLRQTFKLPLLGYLYDLHAAVALFAVMLGVHSDKVRWGWLALALVSMMELALGGVRSSPMTALVWVVVYLMYRKSRVRVWDLVVVAGIVIALFSVIESFRRTMYETNPALINPRLDLSPLATAWAHTAASFKNLQLTLDRGGAPLNLGLTTYDEARTLFARARLPQYGVSSAYGTHNMPTLLSPLYYDFGWAGLLVVPGIYGAITAMVYRAFRSRTNLFWLVIQIDFVLASVLSFRTHRFLGNGLIFFSGVALLTQWWVGRSPERAEELTSDAL